jgi:hypothetical protein
LIGRYQALIVAANEAGENLRIESPRLLERAMNTCITALVEHGIVKVSEQPPGAEA